MSKTTISASAIGLPSRRLFLAAGPAAAVFMSLREAAAAFRNGKANDPTNFVGTDENVVAEELPVTALIERHKAAKEAYNAICTEEDAIPHGDPRKAGALQELDRLSDVEDDAFTAICAHPCATMQEARDKAAYIVANADFLAVQEYQFEALLRSFLA